MCFIIVLFLVFMFFSVVFGVLSGSGMGMDDDYGERHKYSRIGKYNVFYRWPREATLWLVAEAQQ